VTEGGTEMHFALGVARPSNILCAGTPEQREKYLEPCVRGEKWDCMAMTEPGAGSDLRGMKATAKPDGDDWILNGTKHFISHADIADFTIVYVATGEEDTPRGKKNPPATCWAKYIKVLKSQTIGWVLPDFK